MRTLLLLLCISAALSACSSRQLYAGGQSMREQECGRVIDTQEAARCRRENSRSYDAYQRERQ